MKANKETSNLQPAFNREAALQWWNNLTIGYFYQKGTRNWYCKQFDEKRTVESLTGREIEEIYNKFSLEHAFEKLSNTVKDIRNGKISILKDKSNQKQFEISNLLKSKGFASFEFCKEQKEKAVNAKQFKQFEIGDVVKCIKDIPFYDNKGNKNIINKDNLNWFNSNKENYVLIKNSKQFKEFDESLFRAYIDKFSDEDKFKALKTLGALLCEKTYIKDFSYTK